MFEHVATKFPRAALYPADAAEVQEDRDSDNAAVTGWGFALETAFDPKSKMTEASKS